LPLALRERLESEGLSGTIRVDFSQPPSKGSRFVHRSHPLVVTLAEELLERAMTGDAEGAQGDRSLLGRAGVWRTAAVSKQTTVLLLRLRHQITLTSTAGLERPRSTVLLVEEGLPVALVGREAPEVVAGAEASGWLAAPAAGDLPAHTRTRVLEEALGGLQALSRELE